MKGVCAGEGGGEGGWDEGGATIYPQIFQLKINKQRTDYM
jgi:hypothetical protein